MKVKELLGENVIPAVRDLPKIDAQELADVISQVRNSLEYKDMISKYFKEITSPIQEKNGTLAFLLKNGAGQYFIYSNGQLRTSGDDRLTKLASPVPDEDLYTRYINCLRELENKVIKRLKKPTGDTKISGLNVISLEELDLPEECKSVTIDNTGIKDLKGFPKKITSFVRIENNKQLTSLEGICEYFDGTIIVVNNKKLNSLHNIHKYIKSLTKDFYFDDNITSDVLGLILIPGIREIVSYGDNTIAIVNILNKHIKSKDILECQEELISKGFKAYAKL